MSLPKPYRACSCRDAAGKLLGRKCSRLTEKGHAGWYARYEAPRAGDGPRRRPRIGPYRTRDECSEALVKALGLVNDGRHVDDRRTTFGQYLDRWLVWKRTELKPSTWESYREAAELYFKPGLGHVRLADLRDHHFRDLYAAMRELNREDAKPGAEMMRRLLAARASRDGKRVSTRPLTDARVKRVHAVTVAALNDAVPHTLPSNPAAAVRFGKARKTKPLLWIEPRVQRWHDTGQIPSTVMVWSRGQCETFLAAAEAERLFALYLLAARFGLRRSELCGLVWSEADLAARRVHVRQAQVDDVLDSTKSEDSDRIVTIDQDTADVLKAWRKAQLEERLAWGSAWTDSGRVFTREDGTPLRPEWASERFKTLAARAALPPVRFHDLRHGAATMALAAGVPLKAVSEMLGHATMAFTADVYTEVAEELAEDAASRIGAFVRRGTINGPSGGRNDH